MSYPAAVSAATVTGLLLLLLVPGLSLPAEDTSKQGSSHCHHCFYRQTPPQLASREAALSHQCHGVPGGKEFATLHDPNCDTAFYSAFCLSHGQAGEGGEEGGTLVTGKAEDGIKVFIPALLQGRGHSSHTNSPLQLWDSTLTALVKSSILPQCSSLGGDLYILTGARKLGAGQDGDKECRRGLFWSAGCCAVSTGGPGFSVGLVRESKEGMRVVSVDELEELVGIVKLFAEGCGGTGKELGEGVAARLREAFEHVEKLDSAKTGQNHGENVGESSEVPVAADQVASLEGHPQHGQVIDARQNTPRTAEAPSSVDEEAATAVTETDAEGNSTLVYVLSTTVSIFTAPLRPVVSTITHLPCQVTHVLQEDLGVLLSLPGETCSLVYLITSDILSWVGSGVDTLLGLGEALFSSMYFCTSSMLGELLASCQAGVTGVGALAGDTVGILGDVANNAWSVARFFGGRLVEQSEDYVGTVVSEMGGQTKAVCTGFGKLAWRSSNGVINVVGLGGGLITGSLGMVMNTVREAFWESETQEQDHIVVNAVKEIFGESQTKEEEHHNIVQTL